MSNGLLAEWRRGMVSRGFVAAALLCVPIAVAAAIGFEGSVSGLTDGLGALASGPEDDRAPDAAAGDSLDSAIAAISASESAGAPGGGAGRDGGGEGGSGPGGEGVSTAPPSAGSQPTGSSPSDDGGGNGVQLPPVGDGPGGAGSGLGNTVEDTVGGALDGVNNTVNGLLGGGQGQ